MDRSHDSAAIQPGVSSTVNRWISLAVFAAIMAVVATTGGSFRPGPWYSALAKPSWTPPPWLFGPVWTVLYVLIAVAGWRVWQAAPAPGHDARRMVALALWGVQACLNMAWSWLMFGLNRIDLAAADIAALWLAIAGFILAAAPVSRPAAWLFAPYLAWVSFAAALNFAVLWLNR